MAPLRGSNSGTAGGNQRLHHYCPIYTGKSLEIPKARKFFNGTIP